MLEGDKKDITIKNNCSLTWDVLPQNVVDGEEDFGGSELGLGGDLGKLGGIVVAVVVINGTDDDIVTVVDEVCVLDTLF